MSELSTTTNHQVRLARRPVGLPVRDDWRMSEEAVGDAAAGDVVVKVLALSLDPAMRGWMNEGKSYVAPVEIGDVMRAGGIGTVVASKHPDFAVGDRVAGALGVQEYARFREGDWPRARSPGSTFRSATDAVAQRARHAGHDGLLRPARHRPAEAGRHRGRLGSRRRGRPDGRPDREDQGLPRRRHRRRSRDKCDWSSDELGFDACIDYKAGDVKDGLKEPVPEGRRRLLRQRRRRDPRRRADPHLRAGPHRDLRRHHPVQQHRAGARPGQLPVAAGQPGAHGGHGGVRLRRPLSAGDRRDRRLAEGGPADAAARTSSTGWRPSPTRLLKLFRGENFGKLVLQVAEDDAATGARNRSAD